MTDELKPKAKSADDNVDYFDTEFRVDDSCSTDGGGKVFHVGKYYTKGVEYHEQRKEFWLDLAKREAMIGNSTGVVDSALEWAEKQRVKSSAAKSASRCAAAPTTTLSRDDDDDDDDVLTTKEEADEIRNLLTTENKTDFNRKRLTYMIDNAKHFAQAAYRDGMEHALSGAKEFAEKVGLYSDDLELELKDIPSLVTKEQEVKNAIREIPGNLKHATAAVRMGYIGVVVSNLTYAEDRALFAGIDIDEKVRDIIASLTPEQQEEFRYISDERAKAKAADDDKKTAGAKTEEDDEMVIAADDKPEATVAKKTAGTKTEEDDEMVIAADDKPEATVAKKTTGTKTEEDDEMVIAADGKPEATVADDGNETTGTNGIEVEVAQGDEISVNDDNSMVKNMAGDDAEMTGVDDKPKAELRDESGMVGVGGKSETGDNEKVVDQESIVVDEMIAKDDKPETIKKATDDLQMTVVDDMQAMVVATPTTVAADKPKNVGGESDPMAVANNKTKTMTE